MFEVLDVYKITWYSNLIDYAKSSKPVLGVYRITNTT